MTKKPRRKIDAALKAKRLGGAARGGGTGHPLSGSSQPDLCLRRFKSEVQQGSIDGMAE